MWWSKRHRRGERESERAKDVREMDGLILVKGWEGRETHWIRLTTWNNVYTPPPTMWKRCWKKGVRRDIQTEAHVMNLNRFICTDIAYTSQARGGIFLHLHFCIRVCACVIF